MLVLLLMQSAEFRVQNFGAHLVRGLYIVLLFAKLLNFAFSIFNFALKNGEQKMFSVFYYCATDEVSGVAASIFTLD